MIIGGDPMHTEPPKPTLTDLMTVHSPTEAALIRNTLESAGIRAWTVTAAGPYMDFLGTNAFLPTVIKVEQSQLARAREVMDEHRQDSVDLDWSEVDVGAPEDALARKISTEDETELAEKHAKPKPLWQRALFWITLGAYGGIVALVGMALGASKEKSAND